MELLMVTHDLFTYNYYNPLPVLECIAPPLAWMVLLTDFILWLRHKISYNPYFVL
jgi:hypothetical protein